MVREPAGRNPLTLERRRFYDAIAPDRDRFRRRNGSYHGELERFHRLLIPEGASVLQIGCGTGDLLASLRPARGVGIDFSAGMIRRARDKHPDLSFIEGDAESLFLRATFDFVVMSNVDGDPVHVWQAFRQVREVMRPDSRLVITYYNYL